MYFLSQFGTSFTNCQHLLDHRKNKRVPEKHPLLTTPKPLAVQITTNWKILQETGIPDHLTCLLRNLYAGQEVTLCINIDIYTCVCIYVCIYIHVWIHAHICIYREIYFILQEEEYNQWCVDVCVSMSMCVRLPTLWKGNPFYSIFPVSML